MGARRAKQEAISVIKSQRRSVIFLRVENRNALVGFC